MPADLQVRFEPPSRSVGTPPYASPGGLFSSREFFELHRDDQSLYFRMQHRGRDVAGFHFSRVRDDVWCSPPRGPFSSVVWAEGVSGADLIDFIAVAEGCLAEAGARRLECQPPPVAHGAESFSSAMFAFVSRGWSVVGCEIDQFLDVDSRSMVERMDKGNQKRWRRCEAEGLSSGALDIACLPEVYSVIAENRASKSWQLSMSLDDVEQMARTCQQTVRLFGTREPTGALVASAICMRASDDALYVYAWGHLPTWSSRSPVAHLAASIYQYCSDSGIRILDVGTSTHSGVPSRGLLRFKDHLGFGQSAKIRLAKDVG